MRISTTKATELAGLLAEVARAEILPRFRRLAAGDIRTKSGPMDLVTEADEAAERLLTRELLARFPGALVVGEEACAADPDLLGRMNHAELCFVLDPVDGTSNFAAGVPLFGVMLAAIHQGRTIAAWIHDPMGQDCAIALHGGGAWIEDASGRREDCRVAPPVPVESMVAAVSWGYMAPALQTLVLPRLALLGATVNFRCAAHEYRLAVTGGAHLLAYNRLMPWDHAAGVLLHAEAGGHSAQFNGLEYSPLRHSGGLLCAPDSDSWHAAHAALLQP